MAWEKDLTAAAQQRWSALVGYAYLLTGDLPRSEDLVQEALVRAFGRPRSLRDEAAVHAYLRSTVLRLVIDGYRRDRAWSRSRHLVATEDAVSAEDSRIATRLEVQEALDLLPPRERACVVLRYFDDLTVPALAEELGISTGAAKRYLSDAVQRLEAILGPLGDPAEAADVHLTEGSGR